MALVERMSILGIRSFGHEQQQKIEFFKPVTLILGPNGTGKTTIIECLKYATTGDLPPGSKTGCSFIHDPRLAHETEVKAKVTLQIRDVRGLPMIVSRCLVATQKERAKQGTMKTLDGTIKRQFRDGRVTSISSKCAEIDSEMVTSLGVSKAVLENVIFCHQEDSNWPLQEAKSVKQRFDDLFASSRYVKALDAMRKCKMDKTGEIKIYKTELKHLEKSRSEAMRLRCEREELQHTINDQESSLSALHEELNPISERLNIYKEKYAELIQLQAQINSCETEAAHLEVSISNLLGNIQNEFKGTNEELSSVVEDADAELGKKQANLSRLEEAIRLNRIKLRDVENQRSKLLVGIAQSEMKIKQANELILTRDNLIRSAVDQYKLEVSHTSDNEESCLSTTYVNKVISQLDLKLQQASDQETQLKREYKATESRESESVHQAINELARIEQTHEDTLRAMKETVKELEQHERRLANSAALGEQIELIREQLRVAQELVYRLEASTDLTDTKERLASLDSEKLQCESALHSIEERIDVYQQNAGKFQENDALNREQKTKFETARRIRSRHLEALEQIFGDSNVPAILSESAIQREASLRKQSKRGKSMEFDKLPRLRSEFLRRLTHLEQETRDSRKRLAKSEQERSVLETKSSFTRKQLQERQKQVSEMEIQLSEATGSILDFDESMTRLQSKRKLLEEECANEQGSLYLWRKFHDRLLKVTEPDCPVCHRHLSDPTELDELRTELDDRIRSMPNEFARKKAELENLVKQHELFLELRPKSLELTRLRSVDLPQLEQTLQTDQEKLLKARETSEEESARLETCQADEALAKSIQGDLAVLERLENELVDIGVKLEQLQLPTDMGSRDDSSTSIETLQEERRLTRNKISSLSVDINEARKRSNEIDEEKRSAINKVHEFKDKLYKLEQENLATTRLTGDITRLEEQKEKLINRQREIEANELPAAKRVRDTVVQSQRLTLASCEKQLDSAADHTRAISDMVKQVKQANHSVSSMSHTSLETCLNECKERLSTNDQTIAHLQGSIENKTNELEVARKQLNEHKIRQRELADCIQLRQLRNQFEQLKTRMNELGGKLRSCHSVVGTHEDLVKETKRMSVAEDQLQIKKARLTNQLGQLTAKMQYLDRDLKEKYGEADREYLDMMYQLRTTELACADLDRYYQALDHSILAYHTAKMTELNKIIRELWRSTYRGNDIEYIEICSEEETPTTTTSNATRTRRTYNYRVVMVKTTVNSVAGPITTTNRNSKFKSTTEARLDMRGRCSAGQKVLASLIIRLALAEVFCLHCGVLALDEPTTNLDRENIESLAYALVEIIKNRKSQKNFQLIIITHDEDFVELLGRSDFVDHFFMLSRSTQGISEIHKVPIEDHFH